MTRRVVILKDLKINLRHMVHSDFAKVTKNPIVADVGVHRATLNPQGAVCAIWDDGLSLGIKPDEFDFVCPYAEGHTYLRKEQDKKSVWVIRPHPDQRLWVKETWQTSTTPEDQDISRLFYASDYGGGRPGFAEDEWSWRSPMFMPRWASQLDLEVTEVRLEPLDRATEEDAIAEGAETLESFRIAWDKINGKRGHGWDQNPWVWTISFKVLADRSDHT
jgi:hypothetical protein